MTFLTSEAPGANTAGDHHRAPGTHEESTPAAAAPNAVADHRDRRSFRPPTARQLQVLAAVEASIRSRGYPPTVRELTELFGHTSNQAYSDHLRALERKGLLESDPMRARALRVTQAGRLALGIDSVPRHVPVIQERRCDCGAAFFGEGCPGCKQSIGVIRESITNPNRQSECVP